MRAGTTPSHLCHNSRHLITTQQHQQHGTQVTASDPVRAQIVRAGTHPGMGDTHAARQQVRQPRPSESCTSEPLSLPCSELHTTQSNPVTRHPVRARTATPGPTLGGATAARRQVRPPRPLSRAPHPPQPRPHRARSRTRYSSDDHNEDS